MCVVTWPSTRNSHAGLVTGCIILAFSATLCATLQRNRATSLIYITLTHSHTHTHTHLHVTVSETCHLQKTNSRLTIISPILSLSHTHTRALRFFINKCSFYLTYKILILKFKLKHFFTVTPTSFGPYRPSSGGLYWARPKLRFCRYNQ
jgi:hypothetical protein